MEPTVVSVQRSCGHTFGKPVSDEIELIEGRGVAGDTHAGVTVKHRSRVAKESVDAEPAAGPPDPSRAVRPGRRRRPSGRPG